jgi:hypothetical protein
VDFQAPDSDEPEVMEEYSRHRKEMEMGRRQYVRYTRDRVAKFIEESQVWLRDTHSFIHSFIHAMHENPNVDKTNSSW